MSLHRQPLCPSQTGVWPPWQHEYPQTTSGLASTPGLPLPLSYNVGGKKNFIVFFFASALILLPHYIRGGSREAWGRSYLWAVEDSTLRACTYIHIYNHTYVHVEESTLRACTYVHIYIHICTCGGQHITCMYIRTYIYIHMYMWRTAHYVHVRTYIYILLYIHVEESTLRACTYIHIYMWKRVHECTYTHVHVETHE